MSKGRGPIAHNPRGHARPRFLWTPPRRWTASWTAGLSWTAGRAQGSRPCARPAAHPRALRLSSPVTRQQCKPPLCSLTCPSTPFFSYHWFSLPTACTAEHTRRAHAHSQQGRMRSQGRGPGEQALGGCSQAPKGEAAPQQGGWASAGTGRAGGRALLRPASPLDRPAGVGISTGSHLPADPNAAQIPTQRGAATIAQHSAARHDAPAPCC